MKERPPPTPSDQRRFLGGRDVRLELKDCSEGHRQEKMGTFWVSGFLGDRERA